MNFYFNGSMAHFPRGKLYLATNFLDSYDHAFDGPADRNVGPAYGRFSTGIPSISPSRSGWLNWLHNWAGLRVPRHDIVTRLTPKILDDLDIPGDLTAAALEHFVRLVVYTDQSAHRGEGKILMSGAEALRDYPDYYASEWVGPGEHGIVEKASPPKSVSWRYLQIGRRKWWLEYWSNEDWRSNCGEGGIQILTEEREGYHRINHPLFSVDFVWSMGRLFAVDFNTAPGIRGTGIEKIVTATEVRGLIEDALYDPT